jgi:iron(III) transport system substrate-binding protein
MRIRATYLVLAVALASFPACKGKKDDAGAILDKSGDRTQQSSRSRVLRVYSGRTEALIAPVIEMYEQQSGVNVEVKYADTAQLAATILEEGQRSPADVFVAQDASTLALLEQRGVFVTLPASITGRVGSSFRSKSGHWVGASGRARVLAYNTGKLKPEDLPASAVELTEARWRGRVGWSPENASFQSAVAAMVQLEGEEAATRWVKYMQANKPRAYPKNAPAVLAVSRGEVDVALVNHYYLYRLRAEHGEDFPVENHYFRSGKADSLVNVSGAAILASSDQKQLAEEFVLFLLSDSAQTFFTEVNYEFPLASGVQARSGLPDIETLNVPEVDLAKLEELEITHKILREAGALR